MSLQIHIQRLLIATKSVRKSQSISHVSDKLVRESLSDPPKFWNKAATNISWFAKPKEVLNQSILHNSLWFADGVLNTCYNCLDRHVVNGDGDKCAIVYDSAVTGVVKQITYKKLLQEVIKLSSVMKKYGVRKGDRIIVYFPNIPEAVIVMLACARIGAIHSVVFGGFAANELAVRIKDSKAKFIISSSCGIDGSKIIDYKSLLDKSIEIVESSSDGLKVEKCLIFQRPMKAVTLIPDRDLDWETEMNQNLTKFNVECTEMMSSDPLYILYTSGTTGNPKGVVRDNGGHAVAIRWAIENIYGAQKNDVFWAASDVGWVVGHSFMVYGPLLLGCTTILYEGKPVGTPDEKNFWRVIEKHKVNILFTAPTALRSIKRLDEDGVGPKEFDLKHFRTLFLAGEHADPDTIKWAENMLGKPIRDNWWQTETGWPICSNMVGIDGYIPIKYGSTFKPCPGYDIHILDKDHQELPTNQLGTIAIKLPLPPGSMLTLYNNHDRYIESYMKSIPGYYDTGDAGLRDEDGYIYVMSRTDDVINVSGHRLSSGAIEEVIADHHDIAEVAVVGMKDSLKGQIPLGLVVINSHCTRNTNEITKELVDMVRDRIGPVAAFKKVVIVEKLPKTRSGKILRGTLRSIANKDPYKIPATCEDFTVLDVITAVINNEMSKNE
eukprot:gene12370-16593_t